MIKINLPAISYIYFVMTGHRLHFNDSKKIPGLILSQVWKQPTWAALRLTHSHTPSQFGSLFNVQNFQFLSLTFHCSAASRIFTYYSPHLCLTYLWAVMSLEPGNQTDYFDALINQSFNLSVI